MLVSLNENFLNHYNKKEHTSFKKCGFIIVIESVNYFLPITSPKEKYINVDANDSKYHNLIDRKNKVICHVKIVDFILCANLYKIVDATPKSIEQIENEIFKSNIKKIIMNLVKNYRNIITLIKMTKTRKTV